MSRDALIEQSAIESYRKEHDKDYTTRLATDLCILAKCYGSGFIVAKNLEHAVKLYQLAVVSDDPEAQRVLADYSISGLRDEKDELIAINHSEALRLYQESAVRGHGISAYNLGVIHQNGSYGTTQDLERAFRYYQESAGLGCSLGNYAIGVCYEEGIYVGTNVKEARRHYQEAAKAGDEKARKRLEYMTSTTDNPVFSEASTASVGGEVGFFSEGEQAAISQERKEIGSNGGSFSDAYVLFNCYREAKHGLPRDLTKAFEVAQTASDSGDRSVEDMLSKCYLQGKGVEQNDLLAIFHASRALVFNRGYDDVIHSLNFPTDVRLPKEQCLNVVQIVEIIKNLGKARKDDLVYNITSASINNLTQGNLSRIRQTVAEVLGEDRKLLKKFDSLIEAHEMHSPLAVAGSFGIGGGGSAAAGAGSAGGRRSSTVVPAGAGGSKVLAGGTANPLLEALGRSGRK